MPVDQTLCPPGPRGPKSQITGEFMDERPSGHTPLVRFPFGLFGLCAHRVDRGCWLTDMKTS